MTHPIARNFSIGIFLLAIILVIGAYAFSVFEGVDLFASFYYVFLFVTTVGSPYYPQTMQGIVLIVGLIAVGMGIVLYMAILVSTALIEGQTRLLLGGIGGGLVRMKAEKNHTIVCGYGKLGRYVCSVLREQKKKYIIVEKDAEKCTTLIRERESVIQGDALDPELLKRANIKKADGLIATLGEDSDNIYLVMTATDLNHSLHLAAKAEEEHAVDRLHKVGAQIVVLPQVVGGKQLANAFLDLQKNEKLETISKK